jgi:hypothetical protein
MDGRTSVTHAGAVHLNETFTRLELLGLLYWIVFPNFYRSSWLGDDGSYLNLWNGHGGSWTVDQR